VACAAEVGLLEVGADEVGLREVGVVEVGLLEAGVGEVGLPEVGEAEVGMLEVGGRRTVWCGALYRHNVADKPPLSDGPTESICCPPQAC